MHGDGGPATSSQLRDPDGIYGDSAGNIYYCDSNNDRVRKIDTSGNLTTLAGTNFSGFTGDGGQATLARTNRPRGLFVDSAGNTYFSDPDNQRVRKIDTSGVINTVAGTGTAGYNGDGISATTADLNNPNQVLIDGSGDLLIADASNHRIRKVSGGNITTVVGTGVAGFSGDSGAATAAQVDGPAGIALDASGSNLYIADFNNHRVRKVDSGGTITTVAGTGVAGSTGDGGAATSAQINGPISVFVDGNDNLYIVEFSGNRVRKVSSGTISTVAGTGTAGFSGDSGPATSAQLNGPSKIFVDSSGNLYIVDFTNNRIRKVDTGGTITTIAGTGVSGRIDDGGPATSAQFHEPRALDRDRDGNFYIPDGQNHRIRKIDTSGIITTVAGTGVAGFSGDSGPATSAQIDQPQGLDVDDSGNLYLVDSNNHRVRKIDTSGTITTIAGTGTQGFNGDGISATTADLDTPQDVVVDSSGSIYISEFGNNRVRKVNSSGTISTVAGTGTAGYNGDGIAATTAQLNQPVGIHLDSTGNLYIGDRTNHRIRKVDTSGTITTIAGDGNNAFSGDGGAATSARLSAPTWIGTDSLGNIFFSDGNNQRIRQIDTSGNINTVAGTGTAGFNGDDIDPTTAQVNFPTGIFVDGLSRLYFSDHSNHRIRRITLFPPPDLLNFTGLTAPPYTPTLDWSDVSDASTYTLEYADNDDFTGSTTVTSLTASEFTFATVLALDTYYWRVKSHASDGRVSPFSSSDSFGIIPMLTQVGTALLAAMMAAYLWSRMK